MYGAAGAQPNDPRSSTHCRCRVKGASGVPPTLQEAANHQRKGDQHQSHHNPTAERDHVHDPVDHSYRPMPRERCRAGHPLPMCAASHADAAVSVWQRSPHADRCRGRGPVMLNHGATCAVVRRGRLRCPDAAAPIRALPSAAERQSAPSRMQPRRQGRRGRSLVFSGDLGPAA